MSVNFTKRKHVLYVFHPCFSYLACVLVCTCVCRCACTCVSSWVEARCQCHMSSSIIHQFFFNEAEYLTEPDVLGRKPANPRDDIPISVLQSCNYKKLQPCPAFNAGAGNGTQTLVFQGNHPGHYLYGTSTSQTSTSPQVLFLSFLSVR